MAKGKYEEWLQPEGLLKLEAWARNGLTDEQIAKNMGIAYSTLKYWKNDHLAILAALKKGKEVIDIQVENALLKRALGYKYVETTRERVYDHNTDQVKMVVTKEVTKEVQGDTTAQIFWLKNRKPEDWRDKRDLSVEGSITTNSDMTDDQLEERIRNLKSKLGMGQDE